MLPSGSTGSTPPPTLAAKKRGGEPLVLNGGLLHMFLPGEHRAILKNNQNTHYSLVSQDKRMFSHINGKLSPRPFKSYG